MKTIHLVLALMVLAVGVALAAQAQRQGATKIDIPDGANVDGLEIDQNDQGQFAIVISSGGFVPWKVPKTFLTGFTAPTTGYLLFCNNCTAGEVTGVICYSSGTLRPDSFVLSTGTKCGAGL